MSNGATTGNRIYLNLLIGLIIILILIVSKIYSEQLYIKDVNAFVYKILQSALSRYQGDLPVIVLDISDLKSDLSQNTPTKNLQEIIDALIQSQAKAIAIDIDFSPRVDPQHPEKSGARDKDDQFFFEFLHEQKQKKIPVFVGAYNIGLDPTSWLGTAENKDLAVDITLFHEDTTKVPKWLKCGDYEKLNSLSNALAEVYGGQSHLPDWLKRFVEDFESSENLTQFTKTDKNGNPISCQRAFTFVNYSKLELIQQLAIQTHDKTSIFSVKREDGINKFRDKLVIIGAGQRTRATDQFPITGIDKPVAGVYLHASATYTLTAEPVYKLGHRTSLGLDFLFGSLVILAIFIVVKCFGAPESSVQYWESLIIGVSIVVAFSFAFFLAIKYQVFWLDFPLVGLALLLHSKVQDWIIGIPSLLLKIFRSN